MTRTALYAFVGWRQTRIAMDGSTGVGRVQVSLLLHSCMALPQASRHP